MAHKPTPAQQAAIDERSKTLLVSAAAGAGKTTTLTRRIIESLLDPAHPADISRMLVITFTRASAADLKDHIAEALSQAAAERPDDRRLASQTVALSTAQISTVDSFFFRLLREHAADAGVSPDVRIADTAEQQLLLHDLCEELILDCYGGEAPQVCTADAFCELAERLTSARTEEQALGGLLLSFLDTCRSYPGGAEEVADVVRKMADEADLPVFENTFGRYLSRRVEAVAAWALRLLSASAAEAKEESEKNAPAVLRVWESDRTLFENLQAACAVGYDETKGALEALLSGSASLRVRENALPAVSRLREDRSAIKELLRKKIRPFFAFTVPQWRDCMQDTAESALLVCRFAAELDRRYEAEKQRRHICDYTDLEHKLYRLLYTDGAPNDIARAVSQAYDYVYVDEYQDIDRIQHAIIEAVSRPDNRFMVGDVKQSIYAFRRAEPEVFSGMKRRFPPLAEAGDSPVAALHLSENFRSVGKVVDFIDEIFDLLFGVAGDSIGYEPGDRLLCGRGVMGEDVPHTVLIELPTPEKGGAVPPSGSPSGVGVSAEKAAFGSSDTASAAADTPVDTPSAASVFADGEEEAPPAGEEMQDPRAVEAEASYVADEIRRLLSLTDGEGRPLYRPADIAVLLRSVRRKADPYVAALRARGISVEIGDEKDFFLVPEILLALCLLNAIDNPLRDIYLAGLMQSPLWGFSQDDLTRIRREDDPEHPLWESVLRYAKAHPEDSRTARFVRSLARWRTLSESVPTDRLLRRLFDETGLLSASGQTGTGRENLLLLYQYARQFEAASFKGLHSFIDYINQIIKTSNSIEKPKNPTADPQKIQLMTIHASKGLEFKVCFVCGMLSPFRHTAGPIALDMRMGMALPGRSHTGLAQILTPLQLLLRDARRRSENEEEMRVLYVALTRAKERLYVTAALREDRAARMLERADRLRRAPTRDALLDTENDFLWIAAALSPERVEEIPAPSPAAEAETLRQAAAPPPPDPALYRELCERFSFVYPYEYLRRIPGKLSVSRLSPTVLDGTEEEAADLSWFAENGMTVGANAATTSAAPASVDENAATTSAAPADANAATTSAAPASVDENAATTSAAPALADENAATTYAAPTPADENEEPPLLRPAFYRERGEATAADRGTATHLFLQFCDLRRLSDLGVEAELSRLTERHFLSAVDASLVRKGELERFRRSDLLSEMLSAGDIWREFRFHVRLPADRFTAEPPLKEALKGEYVLVQGVIDCLFRDAAGNLCLLDYKTDRLGRAELADPALAARKLLERHSLQLGYYADAVERIFGTRPTRIGIYSLPAGRMFLLN